MDILITPENIRKLLQEATAIKNDCRCIECDGTGWHNYDENGEDIKAGKVNSTDRVSERCEECDGIGYVLGIDYSVYR